MASRPVSAAGVRGSSEKSYFEQQREELIGEIAMVCCFKILLSSYLTIEDNGHLLFVWERVGSEIILDPWIHLIYTNYEDLTNPFPPKYHTYYGLCFKERKGGQMKHLNNSTNEIFFESRALNMSWQTSTS